WLRNQRVRSGMEDPKNRNIRPQEKERRRESRPQTGGSGRNCARGCREIHYAINSSIARGRDAGNRCWYRARISAVWWPKRQRLDRFSLAKYAAEVLAMDTLGKQGVCFLLAGRQLRNVAVKRFE